MTGAGDAALAASYRRCRALNRRHGTTYYWSTYLLPPPARPHVHALYGFCRWADDIVDAPGPRPPVARREALDRLGQLLFRDLAQGRSDHPVLAAVVHTARVFGIDAGCFRRFLTAMAMDLTVTRYATFGDLLGYMDGSAAVIGEMMLPVLGGPASARPEARALGIAFQLTNFLRDVAEDLDRGRVYLPAEDLDAFGARPALAARAVTPGWEALMRFEVDRARRYYEIADRGIGQLGPDAARCVGAARRLYSGILDAVEAARYDVFARRARVPTWRKVAAATGTWRRRPGPRSGSSMP